MSRFDAESFSINFFFLRKADNLAIFVEFSCLREARAQCSSSDIRITQTGTGQVIQGKPEWKVSVEKECSCNAYGLNLVCTGFQTVEPIDPALFRVSPSNPSFCVVFNGLPLPPSPGGVTFTYAWDTQYHFALASVLFKCA
ncbi:uncharacterized protein LOC116250381 [Nymphaea colorata]|nr:uncharacterized protein LOC116250381 [Nymphaea colorata]